MLTVEVLEARNLPSVALLDGTLFVIEQGPGPHTVSVFTPAPGQVQATEGDGSPADDVASLFDATQVTGVVVLGAREGENVIQQNTALPSLLLGGDRGDTIFGGSGANWIDPGDGKDTVYALLGVNTINTFGEGTDRVFTNYPATVFSDERDTVVRFFGPGRTPGAGFIGLDTSLNDGVLYIAPTNAGSQTYLFPGPEKGDVLAVYDLGDGNGVQVQEFAGVRAIAYFGGTGSDVYVNNTNISEAVYGSAGSDTLIGGTGDFSVEKGSGGNDLVIGRARHVDLSGNGGADTLIDLGTHRGDVLRVDALDTVFATPGALFLSP